MDVLLALLPLLLSLLAPTARALDNGLGKTPGLGWNSDYCATCKRANGFQNEAFVKHIADFMHAHALPSAGGRTLQQLGYHYVNMDAGWDLKSRNATGMLVADPAQWPSGLQFSVDYVHSLGLGFGLYGDRGTEDCAGFPGAYGHETDDARFMAGYRIDWYKEDSCFAVGSGEDTAIEQYAKMRDALNATGRPIWFALCGWEPFYASNPAGGKKLGNSARTGPDTGPGGWIAVMQNVLNAANVSQFAGPTSDGGYWNDGSLQLTPGLIKWDADHNVTNVRHRSQFSMWSMLAMNILLTGNLSVLDPYVIETWTNAEVLAVDQDPLGVAAIILARNDSRSPHSHASTLSHALPSTAAGQSAAAGVRTSPPNPLALPPARVAECGGEPDLQQWDYNAPIAGFFKNAASDLCLNVESCATTVIYDGCVTNGTTCGGGQGAFHPNEQWNITSDGRIRSQLPGSPCLTARPTGEVDALPCATPAPPSQLWKYSADKKTVVTGAGLCLTAPSPAPPQPSLTLGRPLQNHSFALLFLNNEPQPRSITCAEGCMAKLGVPPGVSYTLRDLWLHADVAHGVTRSSGVSYVVDGGGASVLLTLTP